MKTSAKHFGLAVGS